MATEATEASATGAIRAGRTTYREVLALGEFRAVFVAHTVSMLGLVVAQLALSVLVYERTGSSLLSALAFAFGFLPYALGGTVLSSVADHFPVRGVLVACELGSAALVACMALPGMPVVALLLLLLVNSTLAAVFGGTRAAILPDILPGATYVLGRSLIRIVAQAAQIVGFGVGGVLLIAISPRTALAADAVALVLSAALLRFGTRARPVRRRHPEQSPRTLLSDSLEGLRLVLRTPALRPLLLLGWLPVTFSVWSEAVAIPYAAELGHGSSAAGLLLSAAPVGVVVTELVVGRSFGDAVRIRLMLPLALWLFVPLLVFVVTPSLVPAIALLVLAGSGYAYSLGLDRLFLDALPEHLQVRALSLFTSGMMLTQGVGFAVAGALGQVVRPQYVIVAAGVCGLVTVGFLAASLRRRATPAT